MVNEMNRFASFATHVNVDPTVSLIMIWIIRGFIVGRIHLQKLVLLSLSLQEIPTDNSTPVAIRWTWRTYQYLSQLSTVLRWKYPFKLDVCSYSCWSLLRPSFNYYCYHFWFDSQIFELVSTQRCKSGQKTRETPKHPKINAFPAVQHGFFEECRVVWPLSSCVRLFKNYCNYLLFYLDNNYLCLVQHYIK